MAISRERLDEILDRLSEDKLKLVEKYAETLIKEDEFDKDFEEAFEYGIKKYDKALKRLVDK
ncbi:hypothetical protein BEH_07540 [Priestia filamentosa]|uniref:Uncharacterized protein n=1 Tax=Priestia filamentosa TaxID=1402861 RepID=A0A0H4KUI7_9BACI|nr:hypothetical protein [Priestia filamentosa]AKO91963.1 hypothetical protein BEH_07540 [Priestia filamentosa]